MSEWQPIETAPKKAFLLLLYCDSAPHSFTEGRQ